ncbi:MAG: amidohydrolase family protein [Rhodobacteraceae bacterium]|nr:amidohydrolase family protein [Paracoccaceae bacterium]
MMDYVDIHPHIIADDATRYPRAPLFGKQSDWSQQRPVTIDGLVAAMDAAGVQQAAIVQASTCYGYDNSYVCDAIGPFPGRFAAVGSVDLLAPDATAKIRMWVDRGLAGLRLFTGGSTAAFDTTALDHPDSFAAWSLAGDLGLSICIQTGPVGLTQVAGLAKRFPKVRIILDHLSRPEIDDGAPYAKAAPLFALAAFENIYLKVTPRTTDAVRTGKADPQSFFTKLVAAFGSDRLAWGSNFPASEGTMKENLDRMRADLAFLPEADRRAIFGGTAQRLYPVLAHATVAAP